MDSPFGHTPKTSRRGFLRLLLTAGAAWLSGAWLFGAAAPTRRYTVARGDSLSGIAGRFNVSVSAIQKANGLKDARILAGQTLVIPGAGAPAAASAGAPAKTPARGGSAPAKKPVPLSASPLAPVAAATAKIHVDRARWRYIVAHHSAIERGDAASYGAAHLRRGMENGLAYHFVIGNGVDSGDGQIEVGPRWVKQLRGGHVHSAYVNEVGIGICFVGNLENHPPTPKQWRSFVLLVDYLRKNCVGPGCKLTVHRWVDRNRTICPGRRFPYAEIVKLGAVDPTKAKASTYARRKS